MANEIFAQLSAIGFDDVNKNPSRYGRLPGAQRVIGAAAQLFAEECGQQRLLYLNPSPDEQGIFASTGEAGLA